MIIESLENHQNIIKTNLSEIDSLKILIQTIDNFKAKINPLRY